MLVPRRMLLINISLKEGKITETNQAQCGVWTRNTYSVWPTPTLSHPHNQESTRFIASRENCDSFLVFALSMPSYNSEIFE